MGEAVSPFKLQPTVLFEMWIMGGGAVRNRAGCNVGVCRKRGDSAKIAPPLTHKKASLAFTGGNFGSNCIVM